MNNSILLRASKILKTASVYIIRLYSIPKVKQQGSELAINHFDQFYAQVYKNWPSIRLGLLCPHHYCAVANTFCAKKTDANLFGDIGVFNMKDIYLLNLRDDPESIAEENGVSSETDSPDEKPTEDDSNKTVNFTIPEPKSMINQDEDEYMPITEFKNREFESEDCDEFYTMNINYKAKLIRHGVIHFPEHWDIFYCPRGKFKKFPQPRRDPSGLLNYYLMDGASVLPVLALDIKKGEDVGDLCASPGGKSLAILFALRFGKLVCNDVSLSRINRLKTVLNSYLPATQEWNKKILVSNLDVSDWKCFDAFDKILLDVPCTNDRMSVHKDANNIFHPKRYQERMQIPRIQTAMLYTALQALKPGGSLIYSTCSLSPIQNDGVVHMALSKLSVDTNLDFSVCDLAEVFFPLRKMFQFSDICRYGQLIIPFLPLNYGPMYICKITRNK